MWCKKCNIETEDKLCSICGNITVEDVPNEVFWCNKCKIPVIKSKTASDKDVCPLCGNKVIYMTTDLRPVFPEERLFYEILIDKPLAYINSSVWVSDNRYYVDGKSKIIPNYIYKKYSADYISEQIDKYKDYKTYYN